MELTEEKINILQIIHDSNNHCISSTDIPKLKIDIPELEDILQSFIEADLVEFEIKENKYYLAYDGFEALDNDKKPPTIVQKSELEQYREIVNAFGGAKRFHKVTLVAVLFVTLLVSVFLYLNPEITSNDERDLQDIFDDNMLNQMKISVEEYRDSIENLKIDSY